MLSCVGKRCLLGPALFPRPWWTDGTLVIKEYAT